MRPGQSREEGCRSAPVDAVRESSLTCDCRREGIAVLDHRARAGIGSTKSNRTKRSSHSTCVMHIYSSTDVDALYMLRLLRIGASMMPYVGSHNAGKRLSRRCPAMGMRPPHGMARRSRYMYSAHFAERQRDDYGRHVARRDRTACILHTLATAKPITTTPRARGHAIETPRDRSAGEQQSGVSPPIVDEAVLETN
jgi:hypothetical protein